MKAIIFQNVAKPEFISNPQAIEFYKNLDRDSKEFNKVMKEFNNRYGKALNGYWIEAPTGGDNLTIRIMEDAAKMREIDTIVKFDKSILEELCSNLQHNH